MWTCDAIKALTALQEKIGACCVDDVAVIPFTSIVRMVLSSGAIWDYDFNTNALKFISKSL